ncbi:MAG TPA: RHS repeat-associated core domain-containing protein [Xanthomonadales bacterium]|nr:RHS repeat-associated core domain-containing protein [Xanthomonadales bacterium]
MTQFDFSTGSTPAEPTQQPSSTYTWASFYLVLLSDGGTAFAQALLVATGDDCLVYDACHPFTSLPSARKALPVDINGDGLADLAWQDELFDWYAKINTGGGFLPTAISIANFDGTALWQYELSSFLDITGDGLPELIYPNLFDNAGAVWQMHENLHGNAFAAAVPTNAKYGNSSELDSSILVDTNGDGMLDNLFIDLSAKGKVQSSTTRVYLGQNSVAGGSPANAMNLVSSITDGFGASTVLSYKPLTDASVYTRMSDANRALWGAGSVVYDLVAPVYVVSQAESSAPLYNSPTARSRMEFRYVGARLQGGGRGFLGFGEVISYDPQLGVRTNTRYRQDFPFIGLPSDTTQARVSSSQKLDAISNTAATSPVAWAAVAAASQPPVLPSGTLLNYAVNQWAAIETVSGKKTWFPHIANKLERSYSLSGTFNRKVLTTRAYSAYGDLTSAIINTYATDGSTAFSTQTSSNTYLVPDTDNWRLGRLSASSVTHARNGVTSITRQSNFAYDTASGILNKEVLEPNVAALKVTTSYQLDAFGNRISSAVSASGINTRNSYFTYDPLGRFVIETRNAYDQPTQKIVSWDAYGNALALDSIDAVRTNSAVDYMGRPFISHTETGAWSKITRSSAAISYCPGSDTAFYTHVTGGGQPGQYQCYDRLQREIRTATQGFDGGMIFVDRYFDASGRPERVSEPYFSGSTRYWHQTVYDSLGRVDAVLAADGNDMSYDYDQAASACNISGASRQVKITNGLGQARLELRNALDEASAVYDTNCGVVSYSYDAMGNPVRVTGVDQAVTTSEYDAAGRKTKLIDADKGTWQYAYNPLGEITRQLDGKNQAIDFTYDLLGRVSERRELSGTSSLTPGNGTVQNSEVTTWNNSTTASSMGKGQVTIVVYRTGASGTILHQRAYGYDSYGRPDLVSSSLDGLTFAEETSYDQFGRLFQQFDASGDDRGVRYHYNSRGYLEKLQEAREGTQGLVYQHIRGHDARGNFTYMVLGNGIEAFATYDARSGRMSELEAYDAGQNELQKVQYTFDVAGNLLARHDTSGSNDLEETFTYDLLNRLEAMNLSAGGAAPQNTLSLQYDASGNIKYKTGVGNYSYGSSSNRPHAVTTAGSTTYSYDANGNQVSSSDGRSISYTVFDQARRIAKAAESTEFSYGIGNQRIKRVDDNAVDEARTTWYFGSVERIQQNSGNAYFKRYIGGVAIADFYPNTQEQTVQYVVRDNLGSIHTLVDSNGAAWPMHFSAFGERQAGSWNGALSTVALKFNNTLTSHGFTGHEHADGLGIIHMNGRIYDPRLGRFLQADPLVQEPKNSQSLNRYSYVLNNPLSMTDPSGYFSVGGFVKKWWRLAAAVVVSYYTFGAASGWAASWLAGTALAGNTIAIGAIAGGIAGFVGGALISGSLKGAFQGAAAGVLMGGVAGYFGDTYSLSRITADTLAGGVSAEIYGQEFKNGLLFGALVSSATYITVRLRAYQKAQSGKFPGQIGESEGYRGIDGKVAGERIFDQLWVESGAAQAYAKGIPLDQVINDYYLPFRKRLSPLGGFQGGEGLIFGKSYQSGGLVDYVLEGYSGVHDTLNQSYFYTSYGTNRTLSGFWQKSLGYMFNPANVLLASPFVLPALVPDYMRHFYFQEPDQ